MADVSRRRSALWLFVIGVALSIIIRWWLLEWMREKEEPEHAVRIPSRHPAEINIPVPLQAEEAAEQPSAEPSPAAADDLTRIDGIGPKYAEGLRALGITSFAQLARQEPDTLAAQLKQQGLRIVGDSIRNKDWIGQAKRLAAEASSEA